MSRKVFVVGVGMTKFEKPGSREWDYPDMAEEAGKKALADAGIAYDKVEMDTDSGEKVSYTILGEDGMRGVNLALKERNNMAGGKKVEITIGSTDASPDSALRAVRKVIEQDGVDLVVGPLSGSEGIALRDYCHTNPDVTIINGSIIEVTVLITVLSSRA